MNNKNTPSLPEQHPNLVYSIPPTVSTLLKAGLLWIATNHPGEFVPSAVVGRALKKSGSIPSYPTEGKTAQRISSAFTGSCNEYLAHAKELSAQFPSRQPFLDHRPVSKQENLHWGLTNSSTRTAWRTPLDVKELYELFTFCAGEATLEDARCLRVPEYEGKPLSLLECCRELFQRTSNRPMSSATLANTIVRQGNYMGNFESSLGSIINHTLARRNSEYATVTFDQGKRARCFWYRKHEPINYIALMPTEVFTALYPAVSSEDITLLEPFDFEFSIVLLDETDTPLGHFNVLDASLFAVPPEQHSKYLRHDTTTLLYPPNKRGCFSQQAIGTGYAFEIYSHLHMSLDSLQGEYSFPTPSRYIETYDPFTDQLSCLAAEMNDAGPLCSQFELQFIDDKLYAVALRDIDAGAELFLRYDCRPTRETGVWGFINYPADWSSPDSYNPLTLFESAKRGFEVSRTTVTQTPKRTKSNM